MQLKKQYLALSVVAITASAMAYGFLGNSTTTKLDNAFVVGRVIRLAAPMTGVVEAINLTRFGTLERGKAAFLISDSLAADRVRSAELSLRAAFSEAGQSCMKLGSQIEQVKLSKLAVRLADDRVADAQKLSASGFVSPRQVEQQQFDEQKARISHQRDMLEQRRLEIELSSAVPGSSKVVDAIEQLRQALIERRRSVVQVDSNIFVYDIQVLPGQWVEEGAQLATVIPMETLRVQANIIESQIGQVAIGQPAEVRLDGLGRQQVLRGHVETIVPATAATFSQVQRNTADSTWMKVAQRIPVVIRLDDQVKPGQVHVGQSAEVTLLPSKPAAQAAPTLVAAATTLERDDIDREIRRRLDKERDEVSRHLRLPKSCALFTPKPTDS